MLHDYGVMNAAALMDRVFELYRDTFKTQIAFSLIIGIISFIMMIALGVALALVVGIAVGIGGNFDEQFILVAVLLVLAGILPLYMGWMYLSSSGHILLSKQAFYGEPIELPFRDVFAAFLRIMSAGVAQILLSVPWILLLVFVIYSTAAGYVDFFQFFAMMHPLVLILAGFAYAVLYVIYSNVFALSIPVAIFEGRYFLSTVRRSFQLIRGDFWRVLGIRMLWAFLVFLFSYSAQGLIVFVVGMIAFSGGAVVDLGDLWLATGALQFYISLFVGILIGPMEGIMTALIYFNQKIKKDGLDIEIGLNRLGRGYTT